MGEPEGQSTYIADAVFPCLCIKVATSYKESQTLNLSPSGFCVRVSAFEARRWACFAEVKKNEGRVWNLRSALRPALDYTSSAWFILPYRNLRTIEESVGLYIDPIWLLLF